MTPSAPRIEGRIRSAGLLIAAGLAIEGVTLVWRHPLSFVVFTIAVPLLLVGGIAMFLLSLVKEGGPAD